MLSAAKHLRFVLVPSEPRIWKSEDTEQPVQAIEIMPDHKTRIVGAPSQPETILKCDSNPIGIGPHRLFFLQASDPMQHRPHESWSRQAAGVPQKYIDRYRYRL
jgi:hypothetical protein